MNDQTWWMSRLVSVLDVLKCHISGVFYGVAYLLVVNGMFISVHSNGELVTARLRRVRN